MRVDDSARRRLMALLTIVGCFLGGMVLIGQIGRLAAFQTPQESERLPENENELAAMRRTSSLLRAARQEAGEMGRRGEWLKAAERVAADLAADDRNRFGLLALQAEALYRAGKTEEAAQLFDRVLRSNDPVTVADRLALHNNREGYARHCLEILARPMTGVAPNSREDPGTEANNIAWLCILMPNGLEDYSRPVALARRAVEVAGSNERSAGRSDVAQMRGLYLNTLGVALYRAGKDAEALTALKKSESLSGEPFNWPFFALIHYRQGNVTEAKKWLTRVRAHLDETFGTNETQSGRHELLLFFREAETTLGGGQPTGGKSSAT